jgi:hypothetical protein
MLRSAESTPGEVLAVIVGERLVGLDDLWSGDQCGRRPA